MNISGSTAACLNKRSRRTQKTFLVGIKDGNKWNLRNVKPLAKKIYTDEDIKFTGSEIIYYIHPFQCAYVCMKIARPYSQVRIVFREVFGHTLC